MHLFYSKKLFANLRRFRITVFAHDYLCLLRIARGRDHYLFLLLVTIRYILTYIFVLRIDACIATSTIHGFLIFFLFTNYVKYSQSKLLKLNKYKTNYKRLVDYENFIYFSNISNFLCLVILETSLQSHQWVFWVFGNFTQQKVWQPIA